MNGLALNVLLAIVWALFSGEVSLRELVVGFLIGFLILRLFPRALGTGAYVSRSLALLRFLAFFVRELTTANVQVALFALRPRPPLNPMIVAVPLHLHGDTAHTILAAVLGLMPGSVTLGFNPERTVIYAHVVGVESPSAARASILRVQEALRPLFPPPPAQEART